MNFALFGRFFLEFAMMYPAEYLCLASLQEHLRAPRKTYAIGASAITLMGLAGAAVCCMLDIETNFLLIPLLIISFWLLRWRTDREVSISQTMFLFSVSAVMMSVCTLLAGTMSSMKQKQFHQRRLYGCADFQNIVILKYELGLKVAKLLAWFPFRNY